MKAFTPPPELQVKAHRRKPQFLRLARSLLRVSGNTFPHNIVYIYRFASPRRSFYICTCIREGLISGGCGSKKILRRMCNIGPHFYRILLLIVNSFQLRNFTSGIPPHQSKFKFPLLLNFECTTTRRILQLPLQSSTGIEIPCSVFTTSADTF
jgi:hypothetical protein